MKRLSIVLLSLVSAASVFSQATSYKISWGEEMKLKKGTADLDIISADNTGLYFTEQRRGSNVFTIGGAPAAYKLYKMDRNFGEVFDKEYKKELRGLDFQSFQALGNDIFLFTTDYEKKNRMFKVYGAKIDKSNGNLVGDFGELGSYELESKKDDYDMKVTPIHNGNAFLMVSNISGKDYTAIGVCLLDKGLKKLENTVINLQIDPDLYQLQDVQYTKNGKIILLGKEYEYAQIGKKKRKRLVFKQFVMGIYNNKGEKEKDVAMESDNRYVISGKLIEKNDGELLLAGFYSNAAKKDDLNGFFINRVNPDNGSLLLSSYKEINAAMLGQGYEDAGDDDDETRESKKQAKKARDDDEEDEFPNSFTIKSVDINPVDNSIVITSEVSKYAYYYYVNRRYDNATRLWTSTVTHVHRFTNQDILVINADQNGRIKWLNALPKSQVEEVRTNSSSTGSWYSFYDRSNYFVTAGGMPFYSSYKSLMVNNNLVLLLNDHNSNNVNAEYGDRVKSVYNFRKRSTAYGVSIDLASGKMTRRPIASNNEETVLMPRHGFVINNEVIIPSWRQHLMAKTELKFAKITVK